MSADDTFPQTDTNRIRRVARLAHYDRETVFSVIDASWLGHIGFTDPTTEGVTVIPMLHARDGDELIFHGARSSRLMKFLSSGESVCASFTLVDGLVLAKSLYHHSMNYRSAVVFGRGALVEGRGAMLDSLRVLSEKLVPGRWCDARQPHDKELAGTAVVRLKIESASAKVRTGGPLDEEEDHKLPIWSGVLQLQEVPGEPIADDYSADLPIPDYIDRFREARYH